MARTRPAEIEPLDPEFEEGYSTDLGTMYVGKIEQLLGSDIGVALEGSVDLIFTSPPFPLNLKKSYGNKMGDEYLDWLTSLALPLKRLLKPTGSLVIEIGNAWEPGRPVMSTLPMRSLLDFLEAGEFNLCQQFVCHNPARLPTPVQWVNVRRIRVKDSFTNVWWMAPSDFPKANNAKVLQPYKDAMLRLLETGKYNSGRRPSGHKIGEKSFLKDNGGSIPPNVIEIANTGGNEEYRKYCRQNGLEAHPALMQPGLAEFFIKMMTDEGDLVLDPFGGSNTTGAVAEQLGRRWIATEPSLDFVEGSMGRFPNL